MKNISNDLIGDLALTRKIVLNREDLRDDVMALTKLQPWRSLLAVAHQWFWICLSLVCGIAFNHWAVYLLAGLVIVTRQHALGVLMHEGVHYALHRSRKWNDFISNLFCAFPVGMSTALYRDYHLKHHRHLNTEKDPQLVSNDGHKTWIWPKKKSEAAKVFLGDALGLNGLSFAPIFIPWMVVPNIFSKTKTPRKEVFGFFAFVLGVGILLSFSSNWITILLMWFIPLATVMNVIFRIRGIAEHFCIADRDELDATRTVLPTTFEKIILAPLSVNFHLEHHLFPSVPFYRLNELHHLLMTVPDFKEKAHLTNTYLHLSKGLLSEITIENQDDGDAERRAS
jgi:fatty acid desaturase